MPAVHRFTKILEALDAVIKHLDRVQDSAALAEFADLTIEVNAALEAAADELEQMLAALVNPVWAELPGTLRTICERALSKQQDPGA